VGIGNRSPGFSDQEFFLKSDFEPATANRRYNCVPQAKGAIDERVLRSGTRYGDFGRHRRNLRPNWTRHSLPQMQVVAARRGPLVLQVRAQLEYV
jgi:hypothetical protein